MCTYKRIMVIITNLKLSNCRILWLYVLKATLDQWFGYLK